MSNDDNGLGQWPPALLIGAAVAIVLVAIFTLGRLP